MSSQFFESKWATKNNLLLSNIYTGCLIPGSLCPGFLQSLCNWVVQSYILYILYTRKLLYTRNNCNPLYTLNNHRGPFFHCFKWVASRSCSWKTVVSRDFAWKQKVATVRSSWRAPWSWPREANRSNRPTNGFNGFFLQKTWGRWLGQQGDGVVVFFQKYYGYSYLGGERWWFFEWHVCLKGWKLEVQLWGTFLAWWKVFFVQKTAGLTLQLFGHLRVLAKCKENVTGHLNGFVSFSRWQFETCWIWCLLMNDYFWI